MLKTAAFGSSTRWLVVAMETRERATYSSDAAGHRKNVGERSRALGAGPDRLITQFDSFFSAHRLSQSFIVTHLARFFFNAYALCTFLQGGNCSNKRRTVLHRGKSG